MYTERERCVYMHFDYHNICVYIYIYIAITPLIYQISTLLEELDVQRGPQTDATITFIIIAYTYKYIYIYIYICCLLIALVYFKWNVEELGVRRGPQTRAII